MTFKVATWNVNSLHVRLPHVLEWLADEKPDVLALQETKTVDEDFPREALYQAGYFSSYSGQAAYNGVATLSKRRPATVATDFPDYADPQRRLLGTGFEDGAFVMNLYVPNGAEVSSDKYRYKLEWLAALQRQTARLADQYERLLLLGDFNIAPEDQDVHDPAGWEGRVLVSEPERAALRNLYDLGLRDAFRLFVQEPKRFSWWDYRAGAFRRNHGLRIDHILCSAALSPRCLKCWIDLAPRRLPRPSDHAPVVAEFDL